MSLALAGCLLAVGCEPGATAPPLICQPGQILATDAAAQLRCVSAPQGAARAPVCAVALTSDGQKLSCTTLNTAADKDPDSSAALSQLEAATRDIAYRTTAVAAKPMPSYVGLTTNGTQANISGGTLYGLRGAARVCADQFGSGAHMCMMDELYQAVVDGTLKATDTIAPSWVYMPNWNSPTSRAGEVEPMRGLSDNCGGYTSRISSSQWRGILVEWSPLPDGTPGFRWRGGDSGGTCGQYRQIACCK